MVSLQFLRSRIKGIKSTQKITRAMQLISASRLHKSKERLEASIPYTDHLKKIVSHIAQHGTESDFTHPMISGINIAINTCLIVVITSSKGLCGAFNHHIVHKVKDRCAQLHKDGKNIKLLCIGKKGFEALKREKTLAGCEYINQIKVDTIRSAGQATDKLFAMFDAGEFSECIMIYSKFISIIKNEAVTQALIPCEVFAENNDVGYSFEPKIEVLQEDIVHRNIAAQIYRALLENAASEHSARMTAMDNATRNSKDMLHHLSHKYNRTRQALITKELIEIISGAEVAL